MPFARQADALIIFSAAWLAKLFYFFRFAAAAAGGGILNINIFTAAAVGVTLFRVTQESNQRKQLKGSERKTLKSP